MSFPRYPEYKDSGVEWLGDVPKHWRIVKSRRLFRQRNERARPDDAQLTASQRLGIVTQSQFMEVEGRAVVRVIHGADILKHVEPNDFVISMRSFQGGIEWSGMQGSISSAYVMLIPGTAVYPAFFRHLLKCEPYIQALQSTSNLVRDGQAMRFENFTQVDLPLPPTSEQMQLAQFLDQQTAKIDVLIQEQQRLIELLKEKRQAVISHAVTKGIDPTAAIKDSGSEWIGHMPAHWARTRLGQIASIVRGGSPRPAGEPRFFNGEFAPWITVGEVTKNEDIFLEQTETMLTEEGANQSRTIAAGTVILTNSGATLGVPKILKITGCANDGILAFLNLDSHVSPVFLHFYLSSITGSLRERMKQGSGQPNLNTSLVSALPLPLPPKPEQDEISHYLQPHLSQYKEVACAADQLVTLLQERGSALISAAVTGKIDVRNYTPGNTTPVSDELYAPA